MLDEINETEEKIRQNWMDKTENINSNKGDRTELDHGSVEHKNNTNFSGNPLSNPTSKDTFFKHKVETNQTEERPEPMARTCCQFTA